MACVENIPPRTAESEMEEGEIVDELDQLSDISSDEEFLLRQRLQVLESYNNILERKNAKLSSVGSDKQGQGDPCPDPETPAKELEKPLRLVTSKGDTVTICCRNDKEQRDKSIHKPKKRKELEGRSKEHKKRTQRKKRAEVKVVSESSEESDDEYRNRRRKLAHAVIVDGHQSDKSSLQARLQKMLCQTKTPELMPVFTVDKETETDIAHKREDIGCSPIVPATKLSTDLEGQLHKIDNNKNLDFVDLSTDDEVVFVTNEQTTDAAELARREIQEELKIGEKDIHKGENKERSMEATNMHKEHNERAVTSGQTKKNSDNSSDDDLEMLRQQALNTKAVRAKLEQLTIPVSSEPENKMSLLSGEEDSDTAELRLICLKSTILKQAMEMKRKQRLKKRLSLSSNIQDDFLNEQEVTHKIESEDDNTDRESVDMDIVSDGDDKGKVITNERKGHKELKVTPIMNAPKEDELEEDEDLLRANLLTSLSKNLPNLVDPNILNRLENRVEKENTTSTKQTKVNVTSTTKQNKVNIPEDKRIVINVGESDSEGEHEATKNLTKMHVKLSEQIDFQQKLDIFLKSTRMEVEKKNEPDTEKPPEKYVAKVVNHLPKPDQIEYKNLVKRMAELERIKKARQTSMDIISEMQAKETLKPRNDFVVPKIAFHNFEEQFASTRKNMQDESKKMMMLKEEAKALTQKYKIATNELKNIATAISFNKKQQRSVHNRLFKIRQQHQRILNSTTLLHSKPNGHLPMNRSKNKTLPTAKLQKENDPSKEDQAKVVKSLRISVANDLNVEGTVPPRLSVQIDGGSNKKNVKVPDKQVNIHKDIPRTENVERNLRDPRLRVTDKGEGDRSRNRETNCNQKEDRRKEFDDYESPLQALGSANWEGDPNAIMCPFEVGGNCKDSDCKYLHPRIPTQP